MTITAAIVLFLMVWFLCLFVALPIGLRTQAEAGSVVPGTPASAPEFHNLRKKFVWVTAVAAAIWAGLFYLIAFSPLTIEDIDFWGWFWVWARA
jgi:predicted secreted protein